MAILGTDSVSAVVWPWRDSVERTEAEEQQRLVRRSIVQAATMSVVALVMFHWLEYYIMACVVSCLAVLVLFSARFVPVFFIGVERVIAVTARLVGSGVTWLLLVPFFYLCFVPGRLILLMSGKDPLNRKIEKDRQTYWTEHPAPNPHHLSKQY